MTERQFFRCIDKDGQTFGVWCRTANLAVRIGVPDPMASITSNFEIQSNETLNDAMENRLNAFFRLGAPCIIKDMVLPPGSYYRRMARPSDQHPGESPGACPEPNYYEEQLAMSRGQLLSLTSRLQEIFQTVHPQVDNSNVINKDRYNTHDYSMLNHAMRLDEYEISLPQYPWLPKFRPFKGWKETKNPTKDLTWYDAYNKVKHDRENNFQEAQICHAIDAVCACMVMLLRWPRLVRQGFRILSESPGPWLSLIAQSA